MDKQTYKVVLDLRAFPLAEEITHVGEDDKPRFGIFIPYEENNVYRGEYHAYANIVAVPIRDDVRHCAPCDAGDTHFLNPYWTKAHTKEMEDKGFVKNQTYMGWMTVRGFKNYINADTGNERGPRKKRAYRRRKKEGA